MTAMTVSNTIPNPIQSTPVWTRVLRLARYVWGLDIGPENEKCLAACGVGFIGVTPEQKIFEMQIAASSAKRSNNPVYHQVLSWPKHTEISPMRFNDIFYDYIDFYKLKGHQVIAGLHVDTDNFHIHLVVNRFDIRSETVLQINNGFDRFHGAKFCCFLEDKYGYEPSKLAAAYKIGDEIVLSDFYNVNSSRSNIDKKEWTFDSESIAKQISKVVNWALNNVESWEEFQDALFTQGIQIKPGMRKGLVFCFEDKDNNQEMHVAASRVSRRATRKAINNLFGAEFNESFVPSQRIHFALAMHFDEVTESDEKYERYSNPKSDQVMAMDPALQVALEQLIAACPKSHILYDRRSRGDGERVHLLDRARGDPTPLTARQVTELIANISQVVKDGSQVRLTSFQQPDCQNVALVGPPSVLQDLHTRGLYPGVITLTTADETQYLFLNVSRADHDAQQKLRNTAVELGLQFILNPSIIVAQKKQILATRVDPVLIEQPELVKTLIAPSELQFAYRFDDIKLRLTSAVQALSAYGSTEIRKASRTQHLKACLEAFSGSIERIRMTINGEQNVKSTSDDGTDADADSAGLAADLQSPATRAGVFGRRGAGLDGGGERQRENEQGIRGPDGRDGGPVKQYSQVVPASGAKGESGPVDSESLASTNQSGERPEIDRLETDEVLGTARDFARKPAVIADAIRHGATGVREKWLNPLWRKIKCLQVAVRHNLEARWGNQSNDINIFEKPRHSVKTEQLHVGPALVRVTDKEILPEPHASDALIADLKATLSMPVRTFDRSMSADAKNQPAGAVGVRGDEDTDHTQGAVNLEVRPKADFVFYDPQRFLSSEEVNLATEHVTELEALGKFDLSELQSLTYVVADAIGWLLKFDQEPWYAAALSAGLNPELDIQPYMPDDCFKVAPQILVFVYDPDAEMTRGPHPDDEKIYVVPVLPGKLPDCSGIDIGNIEQVVLHTQNSENSDGSEVSAAVNALYTQLETVLQPPACAHTPVLKITNGNFEDSPWLGQEREDSLRFT